MPSPNTPAQLTDTQDAIIRRAVLDGADWKSAYEQVCAIRPVTQSLVRQMMERYSQTLAVRGHAKREGAALIRQFYQSAREGAPVEELSALLELAVYHDILRRYAQSADPLVSMTMEQILKLDLSYRAARKQSRDPREPQENSDDIERLRDYVEQRRSGHRGQERPGSNHAA